MAKAQQKESKKVKVIKLVQDSGAYGYEVCEVDESALKPVEKSNPEVFYIFITQIENKVRDLLGV